MLTEERRKHHPHRIFGSEIAAVIGVDPYRKPIDIYMSKVFGLDETKNSHHQDRGTFIGPAVIQWYEERYLAPAGKTAAYYGSDEKLLLSSKYPLLGATPDGIVVGKKQVKSNEWELHGEAAIEVKCPSKWTPHSEWGEPGTDNIPQKYIPQVIWEMAAADVPRAHVVAFSGDDLGVYYVDYDEELFGLIYSRVEKFWRDHVVARNPPAADGSDSYDDYIRKAFPRPTKPIIINADTYQEDMMIEYARLREQEKIIVKEKQKYEQLLKGCIGEYDGIESDNVGKISWRTVKGRKTIKWQSVAEELQAPKELIEKHTKHSDPYRQFRFTAKKENK